ncbi:MAG: 4Fe-4S dicluster domain-containing protein [Dehalococcoidia bacterium]|nr:MAG: 4Fe-4S dicluster domain-containing protein [Dehalococcoidia bacterium]
MSGADSEKEAKSSAEGTAIEEKVALEVVEKKIPVYVMGRRYEVPEGLTIMKAMEYAGYKFIRGCGCRGGVCGACATVYRKPGDYHLYVGLACQTVVEPDMYLTQIPFYPANRASYNFEELKPAPEEIFKLYPEIFRCVACNACTKVCPMKIPVMDVISYLKQGNISKAAELAYDCIQCGLCTSRCMGELPQYHIIQLTKRIYGAKIASRSQHLREADEAIKSGSYEEPLRELMSIDEKELRKLYREREMEPWEAGEDWRPKETV